MAMPLIKQILNRIVGLEKSNTYSTEEIVIGKWIDGKPLYRKVLSMGDCSKNSEVRVATGISNLKEITNLYGKCKLFIEPSYTFSLPIPYCSREMEQIVQIFSADYENTIGIGSNTDIKNIYVIIEYTKTTD